MTNKSTDKRETTAGRPHREGLGDHAPAQSAAPPLKVHSLDEWRQRRQTGPLGERGRAWMRQVRRRQARQASTGRRPHVSGPGMGRAYDPARYAQRGSWPRRAAGTPAAPARSGFSWALAGKRAGLAGGSLLSRRGRLLVWTAGLAVLLLGLWWWRSLPPRPLPQPQPPVLNVWAGAAVEAGPVKAPL